jgi:hypothetical protein
VEKARQKYRDFEETQDNSRLSELRAKKNELGMRKHQEKCIAAESTWLAAELQVEKLLVKAEINQLARYEERNVARERIEKVRAGLSMQSAGRALHSEAQR